jgi:hypothetical protein
MIENRELTFVQFQRAQRIAYEFRKSFPDTVCPFTLTADGGRFYLSREFAPAKTVVYVQAELFSLDTK